MTLTPEALERAADLAEQLPALGGGDYIGADCRPCALGLLALVTGHDPVLIRALEGVGPDGIVDGLRSGYGYFAVSSTAYPWFRRDPSIAWPLRTLGVDNDAAAPHERPALAAAAFRRLAAQLRGDAP